MTTPPEADARRQAYTHRLLQDHETLLADGHRNRAFYQALERTVTASSCVLDIGSGTGVWAIAAALLGAARVVAVEQDPLLMGLIRALARENGVADRVTVVPGDSRQLHLGRSFDLVVSETIGHLGFDEQIVPILLDARTRFLRPGGRLIPEAVALLAAPVHCTPAPGALPAGLPVRFDAFAALALHTPVGLAPPAHLQLLAPPQTLIDVDLTRGTAPPDLSGLRAEWTLDDAGPVNGFAVWAEARLAPGVRLSTRETTSWSPVLYRLRPFEAGPAALAFTLTLSAATNAWTVAWRRGSTAPEVRAYGPAHAAAALFEHAGGMK
ncbi:MAG: class I SAM-dependent methyltransferase [Rhodothermales bacterium]|nr:class I SAM-dependent methyltransferase [Rhodothermales bacterium]